MLVINVSCKKKFDLPPAQQAPAVSSYIKIDSIRKCYVKYYLQSTPPLSQWYKFRGDVNLECTVTADETSGNIYKTVYVEDATGALQVKLVNSGGLYVGDKIRINLNGVILNDYGDMVQLDSVDIEKRVVKLSSGNPVTPTLVTLNQLLAFDVNGHTPFQSRLVKINLAEFTAGSKNKPFADAVGKYSIDRMMIDPTTSISVAVRSSGYCNFANNLTPCGVGTMTLIAGQYNADLQFTIRNFSEVKLASAGCPIVMADFDGSNIFIGGWINYNVTGTVNWVGGTYSGRNYAEISNYINSANQPCETWFISPSINLTAAPNPRFSFESAYSYSGPTLEVYVSTNYSSGNPNSATWVNLNPTLSGGSFNWVNSGNISLNPYKSANTRIAFKYTGTAVAGSRWEIDDVAVFGE